MSAPLRAPRGRRGLATRLRLGGEIVATYGWVRWLVWRHDIRAVLARLRGEHENQLGLEPAVRLGRSLARPIRRTLDPLPWDSRCLMRSLVLLRMLAERGVISTLVIGVQADGDFSAHAWVEHGECPLLPALDHAPLVRL